jgi:hypothetical protein
VLIYFWYGKEDDTPFYDLCGQFYKLFDEQPGLGIYDGHEINIDNTDGTLYFYGPDAGEIFKAIEPVLKDTGFMRGATAVLKFGPGEDAPELDLEL